MLSAARCFILTYLAICVILFPVYAATSKSAHSKLTKRSKKAEIFKPRGGAISVQCSSEKQPISSAAEHAAEPFTALLGKGNYERIAEIGKKMKDDEFVRGICSATMTLGHYKGLFTYLKSRGMLPIFLVIENLKLVKVVIEITERTYYIEWDSISKALILCFSGNEYNRIIALLESVQKRCTMGDRFRQTKGTVTSFGFFMDEFFDDLAPGKDSISLKRFLTLYRKELSTKYPIIFETFCQRLVHNLKDRLDTPSAEHLLTEFVGQPSLLTPEAFAKGFLLEAGDTAREDFFNYGWKEAVAEGLKKEYPGGGSALWVVIIGEFSDEFPKEYPPSSRTLAAVLANLKTKREREKEWTAKNVPNFRAKLLARLGESGLQLLLPMSLMEIITEYAGVVLCTWLDLPTMQ